MLPVRGSNGRGAEIERTADQRQPLVSGVLGVELHASVICLPCGSFGSPFQVCAIRVALHEHIGKRDPPNAGAVCLGVLLFVRLLVGPFSCTGPSPSGALQEARAVRVQCA